MAARPGRLVAAIDSGYTWIWAARDGPAAPTTPGVTLWTDIDLGDERAWEWRVRWGRFALTHAPIIAIGGLLALMVRVRAQRSEATT